jgi:hypothetical protein
MDHAGEAGPGNRKVKRATGLIICKSGSRRERGGHHSRPGRCGYLRILTPAIRQFEGHYYPRIYVQGKFEKRAKVDEKVGITEYSVLRRGASGLIT